MLPLACEFTQLYYIVYAGPLFCILGCNNICNAIMIKVYILKDNWQISAHPSPPMVQWNGMNSRYRAQQRGHFGTTFVCPVPPMIQWDRMDSKYSWYNPRPSSPSYGTMGWDGQQVQGIAKGTLWNMLWDGTNGIASPNGRPLAMLDNPQKVGLKSCMHFSASLTHGQK